MSRPVVVLIFSVLAAFATSADAAKRQIQLYPTLLDVHFADAKGRVYTLTITEGVQKVEVGACMPVDEMSAREMAAQRRPELTQMAYLGATCHGAKYPKTVPVSSFSMPILDPEPAVIVLFYGDADGRNHYAVYGASGKNYTLGTCPVVLQRTKAALLKQSEPDHVGQTFLDASCLPRSQSVLNHFRNG